MRNPTVFVFLAGEEVRGGVLGAAGRTHPEGAAFAVEGGAEGGGAGVSVVPSEEIRSVKARIQANAGGLRLNRVNIYLIAAAESPGAADAVQAAGERLRAAFREDFAAVDMTLVAILNESNETSGADFEARDAATYHFLTEISSMLPYSAAAFDRVFLLSAKNEHGEVLPQSHQNIYDTIAALPLINTTDSRFPEILAARAYDQGRVLFASAGCWLKPPSRVAENREKHRLAEKMEKEISFIKNLNEETARSAVSDESFEGVRGNFFKSSPEKTAQKAAPPPEEIVENIASVAAKPLRFWYLWGYTIEEAERILFGNGAADFFEKNYAVAVSEEAGEPINPENMPLSEVAGRERALREAIEERETHLREIESEMEQTRVLQCPKNPLLGVDYVKTVIGENYARLYEMQTIRAEIARLSAERAVYKAVLDRARDKIKELKALPIAEETEKTATETLALISGRAENFAPIAISLLRDDGLLRETQPLTTASGEPCILRLIGGFTVPDLTRWGTKTYTP